MLTVTLYTRPDCKLCEHAKADLESLQAQIPHKLIEINIDDQPELWKQYLIEIPVVEVGPYKLKAPFTRQNLIVTLGAARDRLESLVKVDDPRYQARVQAGQTITGADRFSWWLTNHYMLVFNLMFFIYVGLPFLAPVFMKAGAELPAKVIYTAYSPLCHELGFRSFFLFGEQPFYPRAAANIPGVKTFGEVTGLDENDILAARAYTGNEQVGYKVSFCERDVAIYLGIPIFGVIFALSKRRIKPLNWMLWLLIAIAPISLDGFSQLFSQLGIPLINSILPYRESTPLLRVITGFLFGFGSAWFAYPFVEESMAETRQILAKKFAVITQRAGQA
jgi:uncharacterized membrane protein